MEPLLLPKLWRQFGTRASSNNRVRGQAPSSTWICRSCRVPPRNPHATPALSRRTFGTTSSLHLKDKGDPFTTKDPQDSSYSQSAANISHNVTDAEKDHFARVEEDSKEKQMRSPWMREGSAEPPVAKQRSAGAMTKGKLLTTPSRMLKLILPLTTRDANKDRKDVEPLALLVHPQQPLSYLERLIQSELPAMMEDKSGKERAPSVTFRAEDSMENEMGKEEEDGEKEEEKDEDEEDLSEQEKYDIKDADETMVDGKRERTGKISTSPSSTSSTQEASNAKGKPEGPQDSIDTASLKAKTSSDDSSHPNFVRWSPSTEIGDFIRDAARGKEFSVDIEGSPAPIYVGVPSFQDRTYYLRMRLRKTAQRISALANVKKECDHLAHRSAQRVAQGGFLGLVSWWGAVYWLTFRTDLGWDVMEPVTYLVGLSGLIGGYMWFLYHNREVSYRSAMNFTVSRRQSKLYDLKGFNLPRWEGLVEEGNRLRREVRMIADEYDVEWDESHDEADEKVREALREARKADEKNGKKGKDGEADDDD